jgi:DNA repair exonuclease SbcCD ATPase subunit
MKLQIESITFSNIMSFGASPTTIDFSSGITLWTGLNGMGKSSALLDTLSFCLYGKPYRKIKIEELINRKNKGNLKTKCLFKIGDDKYSLTRNKEPDKLELV